MQYASLTKEQLTATFGGAFSIVPSGPERRQAGGHYGTMRFEDGVFQKPVRRPAELAFYQAAAAMPELAAFNAEHLIPRFVGVSPPATPDAPATLTIEDVSAAFRAPCVADIKMGTQTWQPGCSAEYRARKLAQDAQCTTATHGFRFSGVCLPDATYGHDFGWHATADAQMLACLRAVLQCVPRAHWAATVAAVAARVAAIRAAVAAAPWSFIASSLLVVYEGAPAAWPAAPVVVLVDFEHTEPTPGRVDTGFLFGCDNLLRLLSLLRDDNGSHTSNQRSQ